MGHSSISCIRLTALKMKFLLLASLFILSVVAEPEAQHETVGFVQHLNGAIVPDDTTSVKAQKALHYTAHVNAALNGFKSPFWYQIDSTPNPPRDTLVPSGFIVEKPSLTRKPQLPKGPILGQLPRGQ